MSESLRDFIGRILQPEQAPGDLGEVPSLKSVTLDLPQGYFGWSVEKRIRWHRRRIRSNLRKMKADRREKQEQIEQQQREEKERRDHDLREAEQLILRFRGILSHHEIAKLLNAKGLKTLHGKKWNLATVQITIRKITSRHNHD